MGEPRGHSDVASVITSGDDVVDDQDDETGGHCVQEQLWKKGIERLIGFQRPVNREGHIRATGKGG